MKYKFFAIPVILVTLILANYHSFDISFNIRILIYTLIIIVSIFLIIKIVKFHKKYDFLYIVLLLMSMIYIILKIRIAVTTLHVLD